MKSQCLAKASANSRDLARIVVVPGVRQGSADGLARSLLRPCHLHATCREPLIKLGRNLEASRSAAGELRDPGPLLLGDGFAGTGELSPFERRKGGSDRGHAADKPQGV